jgi:hypothetical protein
MATENMLNSKYFYDIINCWMLIDFKARGIGERCDVFHTINHCWVEAWPEIHR